MAASGRLLGTCPLSLALSFSFSMYITHTHSLAIAFAPSHHSPSFFPLASTSSPSCLYISMTVSMVASSCAITGRWSGTRCWSTSSPSHREESSLSFCFCDCGSLPSLLLPFLLAEAAGALLSASIPAGSISGSRLRRYSRQASPSPQGFRSCQRTCSSITRPTTGPLDSPNLAINSVPCGGRVKAKREREREREGDAHGE